LGDDVLAYNERSATFWHKSFQDKILISLGCPTRVWVLKQICLMKIINFTNSDSRP